MKRISPIVLVLALVVGLVYVSARSSKDAPTLLPAEPPIVKPVTPNGDKDKVTPNGYTSINIPRLGLKLHVNRPQGLDRGPAYWWTTGRPGDGDTIAIAGHRTTHSLPFYALDKLRPGDMIYIRYQGKVHAYVVKGNRVLSARNRHMADAVGHERLLLTACAQADGSPTSLSYRIVVYATPLT